MGELVASGQLVELLEACREATQVLSQQPGETIVPRALIDVLRRTCNYSLLCRAEQEAELPLHGDIEDIAPDYSGLAASSAEEMNVEHTLAPAKQPLITHGVLPKSSVVGQSEEVPSAAIS